MENSEKSKNPKKLKTKHMILTVSFGLILFLTGLSLGSIISKQHSNNTPADNANSSFADSKQNTGSDKPEDSKKNSDINNPDNSKQDSDINSDGSRQPVDSEQNTNSDKLEDSKNNSDINSPDNSKQDSDINSDGSKQPVNSEQNTNSDKLEDSKNNTDINSPNNSKQDSDINSDGSKQPVDSEQNTNSDKPEDSKNNSDINSSDNSKQDSDINSDGSKQPNNSEQNTNSDKPEDSKNNSDIDSPDNSKQDSDINLDGSKQPNNSEHPDHSNIETKPTPSPKPSSAPKPTKQPAALATPIPSKKPASATSAQNGSVSANGQLKVIGTNLCNSDDNPIVLHGISTAGIAWFPDLATKEFMQTLHDEWATTVFRIAMYSFEGNDSYINNPEWNKKKVCSLIDAAIELDQYVIVDWHILADGNPQTYQKQAIEFFTYIASRYAKVPNILYEICNEPNGGVSWSNNIKPYAEAVIPVIREYSPEAVILVGTPTWSQDVDAAAADPLSFDNVMYSLHFYAGTHKQWLRDKADTALKKGLPLFVTEWGTTDASGNGAVDKASTLEWLDFLDQNQISWCNWSLCNKAESSALLKPSAGTTGAIPESSLTESGAFVKEQLLARAGSKPSDNAEKDTGKNTNSNPSDNAEKDTGKNSNSKPSDNAEKDTDKNSNSKPSDNAEKDTDKNTNSNPSDNIEKDTDKNTNSNPSDYVTQGGLMLYSYNENRDVSTNTLSPRFQLKNTSDNEFDLHAVSFRYYYTPESNVEQNFWCDYADINGGSYRAITDFITAEFHSGTNSYMEISFAENTGTLLPGETATLQVRITNADWSNYDQSNDASFNADSSSYLFTEEIK